MSGFRFRRRLRIAPGLWLNVGKRGPSSVSARVGRTTLNSRGTTSTRLVPGLSYRTGGRGGCLSALLLLAVPAALLLIG